MPRGCNADGRPGRGRGTGRGQSETLGLVLLVAFTIFASATILAIGASVIDSGEQRSKVGSAEHTMTKFDSQVALVGLQRSGRQRATLPGGEGTSVGVDGDAGWMRIDVYDLDPNNGTTQFEYTMMNKSMGAVEYRSRDTIIAYQGGGVWKQTPAGATMVSPPEFHYRGSTLTLPLVTVSDSASVSGEVLISKNATVAQFPVDGNTNRTNPLSNAVVNITVHSDYYRAWGQFFVERTGGNVSFDHPNGTVSLLLKTPEQHRTVSNAVASTSTGEMVIEGSGGSSFTDSYNSSAGNYSATTSHHGTIITAGGVDMSGGAEVKGNLVSDSGCVCLSGSSTNVTGNVSYGGSFSQGSANVGGWVAPNGTASDVPAIGGRIDDKVDELQSNNDNGNASDVDDSTDELQNCGSTCSLPAGEYYLNDIDLDSGDTLELNLSGGDVIVAVENDISLDGASVNVTNVGGSGTAKVYMDGNVLDVTNGATVDIANDSAPHFWIFGPPDTSVTVKNSGTEFVGAVYAPESDSQSGSVDIRADGEVFGAVIGGKMTLKSGGTVHFDLALRGSQPLTNDEVVRVTYLHVSVNSVTITDG